MPPAEPAAHPETRFDRACLAAAFVVPLVWFLVFNRLRPDYLVDEGGHLLNIYYILEGKPGWPGAMTMLPGYHYLVAALSQFHLPLKLLTLARLVPTLCAWLGLAAFAVAWVRLHRPGRPLAAAGPATLLLSLLPLFEPFTGLAYTDVPALAFALVAVAAQFSGHYALAALAFVPALLTRQTNLVWPAFLIGHELFAPLALPAAMPASSSAAKLPLGRQLVAGLFRRTRWLLLLLVLSGIAVVVSLRTIGRLTPGTQTGNDFGFNPALPHFTALLVLGLGLPVWFAQGLAPFRAFFVTTGRKLLLIPAGLLLAWTFSNPHQWNRDLFWDGCTFTLLRNWPLVWLEAHPWLRVVSGFNVVLMFICLLTAASRQRYSASLALVFALGLLQPFSNTLVEPRYLLPAFAFALLFADFTPATTRRLALWWFLLCALHAPFIARGLSLW